MFIYSNDRVAHCTSFYFSTNEKYDGEQPEKNHFVILVKKICLFRFRNIRFFVLENLFLGKILKRPVSKSSQVITFYIFTRGNRHQGTHFRGHFYDSRSLEGAREQNYENSKLLFSNN